MKKKNLLFVFVALLVAMLVFPSVAVAQGREAYVVADGSTLTFYYDMQKASRKGKVYGIDETVKIEGSSRSYPAWIVVDNDFNSVTTLAVFDASFKDYRPKSTALWFASCKKLEKIESIENLNTSEVTDMNYMFADCSPLTSLDLSHFDTKNVTNMHGMFGGSKSLLSLDLSNFDTKNVANMAYMFSGCESLTSLDVSNFDTKNVTSMVYMFSGCESLTSLNVSNFDTKRVTTMSGMFSDCKHFISLNVSNFDTKNVTDMSGMFYDCSSLTSLDVSNFDTKNVAIMAGMFGFCSELTTIYCNDTWKCEKSDQMFKASKKLVGAVAYNEDETDASMANPDTGYFTRKTADGVAVTAVENATEVKDIYTLDGRRQNEMQRGLNIVRMADGTTHKIICK